MNSYYKEAFRVSKKPFFIKRKYLAEKNFSFKYIRYRILRPLLKLYTKAFRLFVKNSPWLTPASIVFLNNTLDKTMTFLEFGSGKSTLYFASKVKHLESIEHHEGWYIKIKNLLNEYNYDHVNYILHKPIEEEEKKQIEIRHKQDFDEDLKSYKNYYEQLQAYPDEHFDFILVDGRARVECSRRAISKLKNGGVFILDNSERVRYKPIHDMLAGWDKVNTTSGLTDTTLWFKP